MEKIRETCKKETEENVQKKLRILKKGEWERWRTRNGKKNKERTGKEKKKSKSKNPILCYLRFFCHIEVKK